MKQHVMVLGAGMVGTCTALELARRGHAVTLGFGQEHEGEGQIARALLRDVAAFLHQYFGS